MSTTISKDGTSIAYERIGSGPALVLVDGAMCYRAAGPMRPVATALHEHFTVYTYDRRGRGESTDTVPFAVTREVEDLLAVIGAAGGAAAVYAMSSGGALALATAAVPGSGITALGLYETPFLAEVGNDVAIKEYTERLHELLDAGRRGDAVELFMTYVGVPEPAIRGMRAQSSWAVFEEIAPTLAYDDAALAGGVVPRDLTSQLTIPTIVLSGSASPERLRLAAEATADAIPNAEVRVLDGQTHDVAPDVLAPALIDFFAARRM